MRRGQKKKLNTRLEPQCPFAMCSFSTFAEQKKKLNTKGLTGGALLPRAAYCIYFRVVSVFLVARVKTRSHWLMPEMECYGTQFGETGRMTRVRMW